MADNETHARPWVDPWTLVGLVLLLLPLFTMAHELLGHALVCIATGHRPSELGAYYVECSQTSGWTTRIVAMAGTGVDVLLALLAYLIWRKVRRPWPRLLLWTVFAVKGMVAAGYWMYSGVSNLGDWGPDVGGGIGPLPWPWLWRAGLFVVGLYAYITVVRLSIRMLVAMLGGSDQSRQVQRQIAMTVYVVGGAAALLVSLFNPHGLVITLTSAVASSFGGMAGLFNVAYCRHVDLPASDFYIGRRYSLMLMGVLVTLAFAAILGPTIYLH
ncbi:hypothetical protein [Dyella silvatica]|uniref:hypothetical protein n=1 Tax=Dyella silvatica TaxID=2992128 RepID=UPI00224FF5F3|nr:hypothetical protein [Dyella silvatica]